MSGRRYPLVERWNPQLKRVEWVETHPDSCPAGHDWTQPGSHRNAHWPCGAHQHREWRCAATGCDEVVLDPPADDTCNRPAGPRI